ncbi:MAG: hypothetical protein HMLIMOIP_001695 [Candidatus Nitrosomirales archaeon]|jgi:hypothetical protein
MPPFVNYVDFEVLAEPWNKYRLSDGTTLFSRVIVTSIIKLAQYDPFGKPIYSVLSSTIHVLRAPKELRGIPTSPPPTLEQFATAIVDEVSATAEKEDWNIYRCEDGATIRVKPVLTTIQRTSKYDPLGEPIYLITAQNVMKDEVPKALWKKSSSTT